MNLEYDTHVGRIECSWKYDFLWMNIYFKCTIIYLSLIITHSALHWNSHVGFESCSKLSFYWYFSMHFSYILCGPFWRYLHTIHTKHTTLYMQHWLVILNPAGFHATLIFFMPSVQAQIKVTQLIKLDHALWIISH